MSFAFLNLKPPVRVSSQTSSHEPTLSPSFVVVRIKEILSPEKYYGILRDFYVRRYLWYCEHVGFPIQKTFEKNPATQMNYGDVIVLEEVLDYGKVYQKTRDEILRQCGALAVLPNTSMPDANTPRVWGFADIWTSLSNIFY